VIRRCTKVFIDALKENASAFKCPFDEVVSLFRKSVEEAHEDFFPTRKHLKTKLNIIAEDECWEIMTLAEKQVVETVNHEDTEISLSAVRASLPEAELGDYVDTLVVLENFQPLLRLANEKLTEKLLRRKNAKAQSPEKQAMEQYKVATALANAIKMAGVNIQKLSIAVANDTAILTGIAKTDAERERAAEIAAGRRQVTFVLNEIMVG
jgi:NusA N-terminal domain/BON domain